MRIQEEVFNQIFSKWLNQFHEHEGGAPIDYQGSGFGGPFHRGGLSKGHDILRFVESIMMFKNGQFAGDSIYRWSPK